MVEPAIGITAAAIATLRPLFINFLSLAGRGDKHHPASISTSTLTSSYTGKDSRPSGVSGRTSSGSSPYGYSREFAEMLGLSTYGVTTTVSAGKVETRGERRRRERLERERERERERSMRVVGDAESQTELRDIEAVKTEEDAGGYGWDVGIKATTTVVIDG